MTKGNNRRRLISRIGFEIARKTSWYKELCKQDLEINQRQFNHVSWRKRTTCVFGAG